MESHCYQGWTERPEVTNARYEANKKLREQVKRIELRREIEERYNIDLDELDELEREREYMIDWMRHG